MSQHKSLTIQSEGFPATIETWNVLNDSVQHALGVTANIIGSNVILKGCDQYNQGNETYVTDGLITIDKQIYSFKGGKKTQGVTLIVEKTQAVYDTNSGNAKEMLPVYEFTYASNGGSGQSIIPWDSFVRVADLKVLSELVPKVNDMYNNRVIGKEIIKLQEYPPNGSRTYWINCSEPVEGIDVALIVSLHFKYKKFKTNARAYWSLDSKSGKSCYISVGFIDNIENEEIEITALIVKV